MQKYQVGQCVWCRLSEGRFWPAKISRVLDRNGELGYEVEYFTEKYNRRFDVSKHMRPFSGDVERDITFYDINKTDSLMKGVRKALKYLNALKEDESDQELPVTNPSRKSKNTNKKQSNQKSKSTQSRNSKNSVSNEKNETKAKKKKKDLPTIDQSPKIPKPEYPNKKIKRQQPELEIDQGRKKPKPDSHNSITNVAQVLKDASNGHNFSFGQSSQNNFFDLLNKSGQEAPISSLVQISKSSFFEPDVIIKCARMLTKMKLTIQPHNETATKKLEQTLTETAKSLTFNTSMSLQSKVQMLNNLINDPDRLLLIKNNKISESLIPSLLHFVARIIERQPNLEKQYRCIVKWCQEIDQQILKSVINPSVFEWILQKQETTEIYANEKEVLRKVGRQLLRLPQQEIDSFIDLFVMAINRHGISFQKGLSYIEAYISQLKEIGVTFESVALHHLNLMFKFGKNCLN